MKNTISIFITISALLLSCHHDDTHNLSHQEGPPSAHHPKAEPTTSHDAPQEVQHSLEALELNEGLKWKMDNHTRASFSTMADSFLGKDYSSLGGEGLKQEGTVLRTGLDELIRGCTMTGAAHDQLHVFLTGYIPAVAALAEKGEVENAREVQRYLEEYGRYFE